MLPRARSGRSSRRALSGEPARRRPARRYQIKTKGHSRRQLGASVDGLPPALSPFTHHGDEWPDRQKVTSHENAPLAASWQRRKAPRHRSRTVASAPVLAPSRLSAPPQFGGNAPAGSAHGVADDFAPSVAAKPGGAAAGWRCPHRARPVRRARRAAGALSASRHGCPPGRAVGPQRGPTTMCRLLPLICRNSTQVRICRQPRRLLRS